MDYNITNPVSLEVAKAALEAGKKIAHQYFCDDEFIMKENGDLVDETGIVMDPKTFWGLRSSGDWLFGWTILN